MAGANETPRQKMIGLMYLVLTALLALNVSSTVIDKFIFINESLERAVSQSTERNKQIISSIKNTVEETGNREKDLKVVEQADKVREETSRIIKEMRDLKNTFIEITGGIEGDDPNDLSKMKGKTDYDRVGHYMMDEELGGEGHGQELKSMLNNHVKFIRETLSEVGVEESELQRFDKIAKDADESELFKDDPNQKGRKFAQLTFENSPTPAGMASVSELETQVMTYETIALDILRRRVGAGDLKFDQILPMTRPESKRVAAGTKYSAELFIAASSSGVTPTMTVNGKTIPVTDGLGKVEFTATPGKYNKEGVAEKSYKTAITVTLPGGRDTTFVGEETYYVVKPVMQIQSASVQALYFNCGNELDVQVPALGTNYNPSFSASGAVAIPGNEKGVVTVVPKKAEVTLNVASNGSPVGSQNFKVRRIPKPEIQVFSGSRPIDVKRGTKGAPRSMTLRAIPDESFQQFLPKDARFRVTSAEVALVRAGRAVVVTRVSGPEVNMGQIRGQARPGDNIVVEIKKVQRMNFRGEVEDFNNVSPRIINISIN